MGRIREYVRWKHHTAGGVLPPEHVVAGILHEEPDGTAPRQREEVAVVVPPQWIGDWESGHPLAPAYQQVWQVPQHELSAPTDGAANSPYRPADLPPAACGPTQRRRGRVGAQPSPQSQPAVNSQPR